MRRCAFTLIEIIFLIAIIALLVALALPALISAYRGAPKAAGSVIGVVVWANPPSTIRPNTDTVFSAGVALQKIVKGAASGLPYSPDPQTVVIVTVSCTAGSVLISQNSTNGTMNPFGAALPVGVSLPVACSTDAYGLFQIALTMEDGSAALIEATAMPATMPGTSPPAAPANTGWTIPANAAPITVDCHPGPSEGRLIGTLV